MRVDLAYGDRGLSVELPTASTVVIEPRRHSGVDDPHAALVEALTRPVAGPPLRKLVRKGQSVAISVCDGTRPQPRALVVGAILEQLEGIVDPSDVAVVVATGTHRPNTPAELDAMLGTDLVRAVRVINHDCRDPAGLTHLGRLGEDVPVWINSEWLAADVRVTTGFTEPHLFAGFSGGPKMVAPGLAGLETVLVLHDSRRIGHPLARWGVIDGNPIQSDVRAIATAAGVSFALDVVLNRQREIIAAFGGELLAMHHAATTLARQIAMVPVDARFQVVLTTNSGFPLDQNLYQAVKGMSAAAQIVVPGGQIVCAAECREGFPDQGSYHYLLSSRGTPADLLDSIENGSETVPDQWQAQIQAKILGAARVAVHTSGISDADLVEVGLEPAGDIASFVARALRRAGAGARLCVLPDGPQTIPYVAA
ncbi:MAG: nickel-dependent lactate racemase [Acidimicrobiales bacterium]